MKFLPAAKVKILANASKVGDGYTALEAPEAKVGGDGQDGLYGQVWTDDCRRK